MGPRHTPSWLLPFVRDDFLGWLSIIKCAILSILAFFFVYRSEAAALNESERTSFANFCEVLGRQLIPYMNRCLEAIFPTSALNVMQGSSSVTAGSSLRLDVKSLQLLLQPVMPQQPTQEEEKPALEKETKSHLSVSEDTTHEKEKPRHENEAADNQEKEREIAVVSEESPADQESRKEIGENILNTEQQKTDLT